MTSYDLDETVETTCGETGCDAVIHCGSWYLCQRCEDFFCDEHMIMVTAGREWTQICVECDRDEGEGE